jgi:hypothetical protein
MNKEPPKQTKGSIWSGIFSFMDKINIKKFVTRQFIFHPPELGTSTLQTYRSGYEFKEKSMILDKKCYKFVPKSKSRPKHFDQFEIGAFKLYTERKEKLYVTPCLYFVNKKYFPCLLL